MDTFATNENLIAAGITPDHAKAIMTAIAESASGKDYVTKADMAKLEIKLESDTAGMATKLDIAELETRLTNRLFAVAGLIIATVALFGFFDQ